MAPHHIVVIPQEVIQIEEIVKADTPAETPDQEPLPEADTRAVDEVFSQEEPQPGAGLLGIWGGSMVLHDMMVQSVGKTDEEEENPDLKKKEKKESED